MRRWAFLLAIAVVSVARGGGETASAQDAVSFDEYFREGVLRLDAVHSGTDSLEDISLRRVLREPVWGGPKVYLVAPGDLGECRLTVRDQATGKTIFSCGFSTLFGEWRTTAEARTTRRAFEETYEMPMPKTTVEIEVSTRGGGGRKALFRVTVDPASRSIARFEGPAGVRVHELAVRGDAGGKVDLLILGDGYTVVERQKFLRDCAHLVTSFFDVEPMKSLRDRFNVRAIHVPSAQSGVDEPRKGIFNDTPFGMTYNTFDSPRYCMTENVWAIHDAAASVPHDAIVLLANSSRYGGGAIYNLYTACASDNEFDDYLCVHEFGHGFAGLGDEYYSSQVSYNEFYPRGFEPWEPNITALLDPSRLKWGGLVLVGTPIPTPAGDERYTDKIGAFEGAGYAAKGLYRPSVDCKMFSKGHRDFCEVCRRALVEAIRLYAPE